jgi:hypothetical protein
VGALAAGTPARLPVPLPPRALYAIQYTGRYRWRAAAAFLDILRFRPAF